MAAAQPPPAAAVPAAAPEYRERDRKKTLRQAVMEVEPVTDRLFRLLPEALRDLLQDRRRQLLYVERQMQRRLVNEFRAQVRELEPVLHDRGRMVGESLLEAFTGESAAEATYTEVAAKSLSNTSLGLKLPVQELAATVDPLITPFIEPFVEGIKAPINKDIADIKKKVVHSWVASSAACFVGGFLLGRFLPRGGDGGGKGGQ